MLQVPREKTEDGQDNTGWSVWECSNICLRYIASDENVRYIFSGTAGDVPSGDFSSLSIVDLSAGAGLLTIAFAAAEAAVVTATDIPAQLPQLWDNVALGGCAPRLVDEVTGEDLSDAAAVASLGVAAVDAAEPDTAARAHPVSIVPLFWGGSLAPLDRVLRRARAAAAATGPSRSAASVWPSPASDIVVASDILFIALRDGRAPELRRTLVRLLRQRLCAAILFGYEERLFREEDAWMKALGLGAAWGSDAPAGGAAAAPAADGVAAGGAGSSAAADATTLSASANDALDDDSFSLSVEELTGPATALEWEDSLAKAGAGGLGATEGADLFVPYLFWEPPPVRLFILRLPPRAAPQRPPPLVA